MNLTDDQLTSAANGEAVEICGNGQTFVLLSKEMYDQVSGAVDYDDSPWTDDEMEALAAQMFDQLDQPERIQ